MCFDVSVALNHDILDHVAHYLVGIADPDKVVSDCVLCLYREACKVTADLLVCVMLEKGRPVVSTMPTMYL